MYNHYTVTLIKMEPAKPIHTLVLDTGPLIKNVPTVSSLIASSTTIITHSSVIGEIRDATTRQKVETTLQPFLTIREPSQASVKVIQEFARRSGDVEVLSKTDILLLALTYEVECEKNGGDWRLRKAPGQKGLNGSPPVKEAVTAERSAEAGGSVVAAEQDARNGGEDSADSNSTVGGLAGLAESEIFMKNNSSGETESKKVLDENNAAYEGTTIHEEETLVDQLADQTLEDPAPPSNETTAEVLSRNLRKASISHHAPPKAEDGPPQSLPASLPTPPPSDPSSESDADSDGGEWITPSNLRRRQAADQSVSSKISKQKQVTLQAALLTTDHAMQNVALLMNLNLMSTSLTRITQLRTTTQRCHACFFVMRPSDKTSSSTPKQFCPRCGLPTLTRVTCSTSSSTGAFKVHLKQNMQWNTRGDKFSIPKATPGAASGRQKGGGKGGWGNELLLAEDQKEYQRAVKEKEREKRRQERILDDDMFDFGGKGSGRTGGRIKVGAGRDVNARRRK